MKVALLILASLHLAAGFPWVMDSIRNAQPNTNQKRDEPNFTVRDPAFLSGRKNTGASDPNPTFNATAQYVDVRSGSGHEFQKPGLNDKRGPCPGLNAAANHNFIPRNGILTTQQAVAGLEKAYNTGRSFTVAASIIGIIYAGDVGAGTWSIGGSYPAAGISLLNDPPGLLGTHNKYEGDASPTRGDAYLNEGDANAFSIDYFTRLYNRAPSLTHDLAAAHCEYVQQYCIHVNPFCFRGPVGAILSPGVHGLVVNMMSNHSEDNPGGSLTGDVLKSFYSVTGDEGSFVWNSGEERIPDGWYKRPKQLGLAEIAADLLVNEQMYPGQVSLGGNTGKVNTFTGIDLGNLTGGVFNANTLFQGNNLFCFLFQATRSAAPGQLGSLLGSLAALLGFLKAELDPIIKDLGCPQLDVFQKDLFAPYPGAASYLS